jgi:hypothetical protein
MRQYITKREVLFSIVIIALMLTIGFVLSDKINDNVLDKYKEYDTALQIDNDAEMFKYAMKTNLNNAFVYGELRAVDPVTYEEIGGEYSYIEKFEEHYTMHTRTVTKTRTVNGKTQTYTEVETYWSWDVVDSQEKHSNIISFLGVNFDYGTIHFPNPNYITTLDGGYHVRFSYYGSPVYCNGTAFGRLHDNTISDVVFYNELNITDTISELESGMEIVLFWVLWTVLIIGLVVWFYYKENNWLEDR